MARGAGVMEAMSGEESHNAKVGKPPSSGRKEGEVPADSTPGRSQPLRHRWSKISLGRVCLACQLAQAAGEFDDDASCAAK